VVIDAARLHPSLVSDLSKRRCGIALLSKEQRCDAKDKVA